MRYSAAVLGILLLTSGIEGQDEPAKKVGGRLSAVLAALAQAHDDGKAAAFLTARGLRGAGGAVDVLLEPADGGAHTIDRGLLKKLGAVVTASSRSWLRVRVQPGALRGLTSHPGVKALRTGSVPKALSFGNPSGAEPLTGADAWHAAGQTGAGVQVAVVDLGFIGLAAKIAAGELPADTAWTDYSGTGIETDTSHGVGVAEHVADMAPGAKIHCLKVGDELDLQQAADYCAANGIRIANHSVGWVNASYYDDSGPINAIVNESRDVDGVLWCVAAGNDRKAHWRGAWNDPDADNKLNFTATDELMDLTTPYSIGTIFLNWNQYGNSLSDLDLYVRNKNNTIVASSTGSQTGTQEPAEAVSFNYVSSQAPYRIEVRWYSGPKIGLDLTIFSFYNDLEYATGASSLMDPADAHGAFSVAAIDRAVYAQALPPAETFSSMGPTTDGRAKPDIAAPDGTSSLTYGVNASFGTSFSSPTTAGTAALILGQSPGLTAGAVETQLRAWATGIGSPSEFGAGKLTLAPPGPPPSNRPPVANAQTVSVVQGESVAITLTGSDPDGDVLTYAFTNPLAGTLSGIAPSLVYTAGAPGLDTFTFMVSDGQAASASATVTINILKAVHVASVAMSTERSSRNYRAKAAVRVVDAGGNAVSGALISGSWSGAVTGAQSMTTDASGNATFTSAWKKSKGPFTFTVTGVSGAGLAFRNAGYPSSGTITAP